MGVKAFICNIVTLGFLATFDDWNSQLSQQRHPSLDPPFVVRRIEIPQEPEKADLPFATDPRVFHVISTVAPHGPHNRCRLQQVEYPCRLVAFHSNDGVQDQV